MAKKKNSKTQGKRLLTQPSGQLEMYEKSYQQELEEQKTKPVECFGQTFENDDARREHFLNRLREGLEELDAKLGGVPFTDTYDAVDRMKSLENWPMGNDERLHHLADRMRRGDKNKDLLQLWKDEIGFPHGEIEDVLALSDPPYYTACPNPFIGEFINHYGKPYDPSMPYSKEPFAADVKEGKQNAIYNVHSYHTKVPHKAIMRYILHYTEPGDIVFDGFCGTGMTGVAAQMCGDRKKVMELGYQIKPDGTILQEETRDDGKTTWVAFSKLGVRRAILNDLSPAAIFIARNYNAPADIPDFEKEAKQLLKEIEDECGWMYMTKHSDGRMGYINFTIWSDVFICNNCAEEIVFWEEAIDKESATVLDSFPCPNCSVDLSKRSMNRAWVTSLDAAINKPIKQAKQIPVLINYSLGGASARYEKQPDQSDYDLLDRIEKLKIGEWYPSSQIPRGDKTSEPIKMGTTHVHHFYTKRNLAAVAYAYSRITTPKTRFLFTAFIGGATKLNQLHLKNYVFGGGGCNPGPRKGVIYTPSISLESSVPKILLERFKTQSRGLGLLTNNTGGQCLLSVGSASILNNSHQYLESLDYVFIDPPFGSNLMYSELSHTWESWLKIHTNNKQEAIENKTQKKTADEYRHLMTECFAHIYALLKPGRWMTVEFSNTRAHVWNNIQAAITSP